MIKNKLYICILIISIIILLYCFYDCYMLKESFDSEQKDEKNNNNMNEIEKIKKLIDVLNSKNKIIMSQVKENSDSINTINEKLNGAEKNLSKKMGDESVCILGRIPIAINC